MGACAVVWRGAVALAGAWSVPRVEFLGGDEKGDYTLQLHGTGENTVEQQQKDTEEEEGVVMGELCLR